MDNQFQGTGLSNNHSTSPGSAAVGIASPVSSPRGSSSNSVPPFRTRCQIDTGGVDIEMAQGNDNVDDSDAPGWPQIAAKMTECDPFRSFARFRKLNIKMLLYYQVELACLQRWLADEEVKCEDNSWEAGLMVPKIGEGEDQWAFEWKLVKRIRTTLEEYNRLLQQFTEVSSLPEPTTEDVNSLHNWMLQQKYGNPGQPFVAGPGSDVWGGSLQAKAESERPQAKNKWALLCALMSSIIRQFSATVSSSKSADLVLALPKEQTDGLTRWVMEEGVPLYDELLHSEGQLIDGSSISEQEKKKRLAGETYSGQKIANATGVLAVILACALPTAGIGILAIVNSLAVRIILIGVFSMLLSSTLLLLTTCSRVEVFMATAAFAAVLVVFIQDGRA